MSKVICINCQKESEIEKSGSVGKDAAQVQNAGWRVKNPVFFTGISQWYFYCCDECLREHYEPLIKNACSEDERKEIRKEIAENKKKAIEGSQRIVDSMIKFRKELKKKRKL